MDDLFVFNRPENARTKNSDSESAPALLDSHILGEDVRMMPIVRVLIGMLLQELVAWTATLGAALVFPLFISADGRFAGICLGLMVVSLVILGLCYGVMVGCRRHKEPPVFYFMVVLHTSILVLCVCSAILIHALATLCFVLMIWTGTLAMLLKLAHSPEHVNAQQLALLSLYSSVLVCFVCVAQELTFKDLAVNIVAFLVNGLFIAFRYDWLLGEGTSGLRSFHHFQSKVRRKVTPRATS